jgi:hypothetical protein
MRHSLSERAGGLAWLLPVGILIALAISGVAGYFIYKAMTYTDVEASKQADPGKEGVPSIEENRASIHRPVVWEVEMSGLPPGAEVYVEGAMHPERPIVLDGHQSPYTFRVMAEGFLPWEQPVEVHSDLTLAIRMWTPEEAAAMAEEAAKRKKKGKGGGEAPAGPTELTFDGSGTGEGESVKKKKKGKLLKPTSPGITKLKSLGKQ